jgi:hypothetical protein
LIAALAVPENCSDRTLGKDPIAIFKTMAIDQPTRSVSSTTMLTHSSAEWIASDRRSRPANVLGCVMPAFGIHSSLLIVIFALTGIVPALIGPPARAKDLDRGKSGADLVAGACADCHHGPRVLAKGRLSWTP